MASEQPSDRELIARLSAGDSGAAMILYDRHCRLLWSLAMRIVHDSAEAEDIIQDLFVRVWQQCRTYDPGRGDVRAWLCQMARTMAIDRHRSTASRETREQGYGRDQESEAARLDEPPYDPAWGRVRRAVKQLPGDEKRLIETAYFEGLSQSEIANRFGMPLGTVKTKIRQAMLRLREQLNG